jgi:hypothetical protein
VLIFSSSFAFSDLNSDLRFRIRSLMFLADSLPFSSYSLSFCSSIVSYYSLSLPCKAEIIYGADTCEPPPKVFFCSSSAVLTLTSTS